MAFAVVQDADTTSGEQTTNATSWAATFPANIAANNLLVCIVSADGNPDASVTGFTLIGAVDAPASQATLNVLAKDAAGTETGAVTITVSVTERGCWRFLRITGWKDSGVLADDVKLSTGATGTDDLPDPDTLTPGWGAEDILWLALAIGDDDTAITTYPASYTNTSYQNAGATNGSWLATGRRELASTSENPTNFDMSASTEWAAATLGIRPSVSGIVAPGLRTVQSNLRW